MIKCCLSLPPKEYNGTVPRDREKIGQWLTGNPRKNCGTHFGSSFLIVSKVGLANDCAINNLMRFLRRVRSLTPLTCLCY